MTAKAAPILLPHQIVSHFWGQRSLVRQFAVRDFQARFQGTLFGFVWSLAVPLVMLVVYTFVFSVIFNARWGTLGGESRAMFAVIIFGNLIPYNLFSEVISASTGLMLQNQNLIKKVVFPLEVLPVARLLAAVFQALASIAILLVGVAMVGELHWQIVLAPLVLIPLLLYALGLSYVLATLTVFVRDIGQVIGIFLTLLLYLSPIFYPVEAVPESVRSYVRLNPLAPITELFRGVMIAGETPDLKVLGILWLTSSIMALLGFLFFMKAKPSFADVI